MPGGQALGERHHVGCKAGCILAEPFAGAAEAAHDLVGQAENVVLAQELMDLGEVGSRRHDDAATGLDRLGDEGRDGVGSFAQD